MSIPMTNQNVSVEAPTEDQTLNIVDPFLSLDYFGVSCLKAGLGVDWTLAGPNLCNKCI